MTKVASVTQPEPWMAKRQTPLKLEEVPDIR